MKLAQASYPHPTEGRQKKQEVHYIPSTYLSYNWKFVPFAHLHPFPLPALDVFLSKREEVYSWAIFIHLKHFIFILFFIEHSLFIMLY